MAGYFQAERDLWTDPLFKDENFTEREAWLWMRSRAAWSDFATNCHGKIIKLKRGQLIVASRVLAKEWRWPEATVRRYLNKLQDDQKIVIESDAPVNVATICNYDIFFGTGAGRDAQMTQTRRAPDAHKEKKKEKEKTKKDEVEGTQDAQVGTSGESARWPVQAQQEIPLGTSRLFERVVTLVASMSSESGSRTPHTFSEQDLVLVGTWVNELRLTEDEVIHVVKDVLSKKKSTNAVFALNYFARPMKNFAKARGSAPKGARGSMQKSSQALVPVQAKEVVSPMQSDWSKSNNADRRVTAKEAQKIIQQFGLSSNMNTVAKRSASIGDIPEEDTADTKVSNLSRIETLPMDHPERRTLELARSKNLLVQEARADQQRRAEKTRLDT